MTDPAPSVYLFYGDDEFAIKQAVADLRDRLGDPTSAEMNFDGFNGADIDFDRFSFVCHALPFLSPRRMVVLESCERLPKSDSFWTRMVECLETLPESTALILIEDLEFYSNKRKDFFKESNLWSWCQSRSTGVYTRNFTKLKGARFLAWVQERFNSAGVEINRDAAALLSELSQEDPRIAAQEIDKLLAYVNYARRVEAADVQLVCISQSEANIFAMVDAIGSKDLGLGMGLMREILEEQDIGRVFSMIVRQFRLLLLTKEALDAGRDPRESLPSRTPDFVQTKLVRQANNFSLSDLVNAHHSLMRLDLENKSGQGDLSTGLELFVLDLIRAPSEAHFS